MQRLNVKLLIWLGVGAIVLIPSFVALHWFQTRSNAGQLLEQTEKKEQEGDIRAAAKAYSKYVKDHPSAEGFQKLKDLFEEMLKRKQVQPEDLSWILTTTEMGVRAYPELDDVRRFAIRIHLGVSQVPAAISHMNMLKSPNIEDELLLCNALMQMGKGEDLKNARDKLADMVGFDQKTFKFTKGARGAQHPPAYLSLVNALNANRQPGESANKVSGVIISQMMKLNANSALAYHVRGEYLMRYPDPKDMQASFKAADEDLQKSLEMNPDDAGAFLLSVQCAQSLKDRDRVEKVLPEAIKRFPKLEQLYLFWVRSALQREDIKVALERIAQGLEAIPESAELKILRAQIHLEEADGEATVERELAELRKDVRMRTYVTMVEGQMAMKHRRYLDAIKRFEQIRPQLRGQADKLMVVESGLLGCYVQLYEYDKAAPVARRILAMDPTHEPAKATLELCLRLIPSMRDASEEAASEQRTSELLADMQAALGEKLQKELKKPKKERDFTEFDQSTKKVLDASQLTESARANMELQLMLLKEQREEANAVLVDAKKKFASEAWPWQFMVNLALADKDFAKAWAVIENGRQEAGEQPFWYILPIAIRETEAAKDGPEAMAAAGKAEMKKQMASLDKLPIQVRAGVYGYCARHYLQLNDLEGAKECLKAQLKETPENVVLVRQMFQMSLNANDEAGMEEALAKMQEMKGKDSDYALINLAQLIIWQVENGKKDKSALGEAEAAVNLAMKQRNEWGEPFFFKGRIFELRSDIIDAIEAYKMAEAKGVPARVTAPRLLLLLANAGRMKEAETYVESAASNSQLGGPTQMIAVEVLFQNGRVERAIQIAKQVIGNRETSANLAWLGGLQERAQKLDDAELSYTEATKRDPKDVQAWLRLVRLHVNKKEKSRADEIVQKAKQNLPEEGKNRGLAQMYEAIGDAVQAEEFYQKAAEESPANLDLVWQIAQFYSTNQKFEDAVKWLDKILASSEANHDAKSRVRRTKARIVASRNSYRTFREGVELINQNMVNDKLSTEDELCLAQLYATRPETAMQDAAINKYEQVQIHHPLATEDQLRLVLLYQRREMFKKAREAVITLIGRDEKNPLYIAELCALYLEQHEGLAEVESWIARLETIDAKYANLPLLKAWLLSEQGNKEGALQLLAELSPKPPLSAKDADRVRGMAENYRRLGFDEQAEKLMREYLQLDPRAALLLGTFLAEKERIVEAMDLFDEARKSFTSDQIVTAALSALRVSGATSPKTEYERVAKWIEEAYQQGDPAAVKGHWLQMAELRDVQNNYPEAAKCYRAFLAETNHTELDLAVAKNNLSYILAVKPELSTSKTEVQEMLDQAAAVLGKTSDVLDTQAMVCLVTGKLEEARKFSISAVNDGPSPIKYLHLAMIHNKAGRPAEAMEAFQEAKKMRLDPKQLQPIEVPMYEELKKSLGM